MAGLPFTNPQNHNQNPIPVTAITCTVSSAVTALLIRHLPEAIPEQTLSHHGASSVRPYASIGRLKNCAYVDFPDGALALRAQRQFNGLRFLDKVLKVERASKQPQDDNKLPHSHHKVHLGKDSTPPSLKTSLSNNGKDNVAEQVSKSNPLTTAEPIAPRLGVDYPFPPHLEYVYPPPDGNILTNILNALNAVPRFYIQEFGEKSYTGGASGRKHVK